MELADALKNLGFTQQEALLYIKLSQTEGMTGYEAAKTCGISRSNAYASLSNLADKGYAYMIEGNPVRYIAVEKEDLIANAMRDFKATIKLIENQLPTNVISNEPYITITGQKAILDRLRNMILQASARIYLSMDSLLLEKLHAELEQASEKGLKVVILAMKDLDFGTHIYYKSNRNTSIKVIADTKEILAGTLDQCLYSKNDTLVKIIRESMLDEITLINERSQ